MRERDRGSSIVEFSLVLVLLLTLIFAMMYFGTALYAYHYVSSAARDATRYAMVRGSSCSSLPDCNIGQTGIQNYVVSHVPAGVNASLVNATISWPIEPNSAPICSSSQNSPGCFVNVQVTYPFSFSLPFVPFGTITMESSSQMMISQ
jgi:Flp pilus assembly protein TadG